jgi:hypothetical protein
MNPTPGFWLIFGPLGPTAGSGSLGMGSGSKDSAGCASNQPRKPIIRPVRGYFVFLVPSAKHQKRYDKSGLNHISQAGAVGQAPGANVGRKPTKNSETNKISYPPICPCWPL